MSEDRLQKILARAGVTSRRKAEELIRDGQVTVNGRVAELGEKADPERDAIKVLGKRIQLPQRHHYLLLNKPKGVVSTLSDPEGRTTVLDLIPPMFHRALVPVGRLDFNTEGLLLLTDDGELAQRVAHPRYGSVKVYEVKVKGVPKEGDLQKLRGGIVLEEGRRSAPCRISPLGGRGRTAAPRRRPADADEGDGNSWWKVELQEGRTRQIREMFYRIGHGVLKLRRVAIGPLQDRDLPVGAVRELTEAEVALLQRGAKEKPAGGREKPRPATPRPPAPARAEAPRRASSSRGPASPPSRRPAGPREKPAAPAKRPKGPGKGPGRRPPR